MNRMKCAAALMFVAFASGCAITPSVDRVYSAKGDLALSTVCCKSLVEAPSMPLPANVAVTALDKSRQAFIFGQDKAFFLKFELPTFAGKYVVAVSGTAAGPVHDRTLVAPSIWMLNGAGQVTRKFEWTQGQDSGERITHWVEIDSNHAQEKYLVVYAARSDHVTSTNYTQQVPVMVHNYYRPHLSPGWVYMPQTMTQTVRHSPVGLVTTEVLRTPAAKPQ
jgi:hypothetical protein